MTTSSEKTSLKERLKEQESLTLALVDETKLLKEKRVSLQKSVHDIENQMIEQKSMTKSEIQGSNYIRQNPKISKCFGVFGLSK